jgi:biotin operon repressor
VNVLAELQPEPLEREVERISAALADLAAGGEAKPHVTTTELPGGHRWRLAVRMANTGDFSLSATAIAIGTRRLALPKGGRLRILEASVHRSQLVLEVGPLPGPALPAELGKYLQLAPGTLKMFEDRTRTAAAARALRTVLERLAAAPMKRVAEIAASPTDLQVAVGALEQLDAIEIQPDAFTQARLRGLRERERLLDAEGGTLTADQVAQRLGLTRQAVNKRRQAGTLVGLEVGRHGYRYPAWQFTQRGVLDGLAQVLAALAPADAWMQHTFVLSPNSRLDDRRPLDEWRAGRLDRVLRAARTFGEHGAA